MTALKPPALDPDAVAEVRGSGYPEPFKSRIGDRAKQRLGEACGLTKFGVNLVTLGPGGEVVLITNTGEQLLAAGMCAGYPAGNRDAHHFVNRSQRPAKYLEIGNRVEGDAAFYPDDDLLWIETEAGTVAAHKDGRRY